MLAVVAIWVAVADRSRLAELRGEVLSSLAVRQQLVADLPARVVLRPLRAAVAPESSVVSRGRRAVLPGLAVAAAAWTVADPGAAPPDPDPAAPGRRSSGARRGLGDRDGAAVSPQPRLDANLRGHRHAGLRAAVRRGFGDGVAEPVADHPRHRRALGASSTSPAPSAWSRSRSWCGATNEYSAFLYPYGIVLLSVATVAVVAVAAHPATRIGRVLGWGPLRWLGVRSYGIYLWHEPIIVLTTPGRRAGGRTCVRAAAQVAASRRIGRALLALHRGTDPPRRAREVLGSPAARADGAPGCSPYPPRVAFWPAGSGGGARWRWALAGVGIRPPRHRRPGRSRRSSRSSAVRQRPPSGRDSERPAPRPGSERSPTAPTTTADPDGGAPADLVPIGRALRRLHFIGAHLRQTTCPIPASGWLRSTRASGVRRSLFDITPATSIVETPTGTTDAYHPGRGSAARRLSRLLGARAWHQRRRRCLRRLQRRPERPHRSDDVRHRRPACDVGQRQVAGPQRPVRGSEHAALGRRRWSQACSRYPEHARLRLGRAWPRTAGSSPTGSTTTRPGYAARAHLIADALAEAFPAHGQSASRCVVETKPLSVPVLDVPH